MMYLLQWRWRLTQISGKLLNLSVMILLLQLLHSLSIVVHHPCVYFHADLLQFSSPNLFFNPRLSKSLRLPSSCLILTHLPDEVSSSVFTVHVIWDAIF
jgi:hypothetical protein